MFDLGSWGEFLIIAIVALIVIKPEDIPNILKTVGRILAKMRSYGSNLQMSLTKAIQSAEQEEIKRSLDKLHTPIGQSRSRKNKQPDD
jgi:sec-independent protein translocase protein TatB